MSSAATAAAEIAARVASAAAAKTPLILQGGGGKMFYGNPPAGEILDLSPLSGVSEYEPSELFVAVAAATPLAEIESLLRQNGQMLAFEPPHFSPRATAGGALACGLSGPRRPAGGALRDHVLGATIIDGRGRRLVFGGKVIKNVAGFDVSRLQAGAMGVLGVAAEIVFRAAPLPECEITTVAECPASEAVAEDNRLLAAGLPLTGGAWCGGQCRRRFSGGEESLQRAAREAGGDIVSDEEHREFWRAVREHEHPFFAADGDLWRIAAPPTSPLSAGDEFVEWHGAIRWRRGGRAAAEESAKRAGGAATLFRAADPKCGGRFPPPPAPLLKIYRNLKKAFDPEDILNRGRLYDFGG
ncbi:MAG: glycolate oxidase subunit GlcE [Gammaproteobacteria bacterium]